MTRTDDHLNLWPALKMALIAGVLALGLTACGEADDDASDAVEETGEALEEAGEDAIDAVEDAADDVEDEVAE